MSRANYSPTGSAYGPAAVQAKAKAQALQAAKVLRAPLPAGVGAP